MRAVLQRVSGAEVSVGGESCGRIDHGLLVYVGVAAGDTEDDASKLAEKVTALRIFNDEQGRLNLSVRDVDGGVLAIPNFTLLGDARKGRRPSYTNSAPAGEAEGLFNAFVQALALEIEQVEKGVFGADMTIESAARGPVNIIVDITS
jgi:D-tyrosyl-tRNA(Tyr) deacylase